MKISSLGFSILDGIFWSLMVGLGESYFVPYAISLGASDTQIGMLATFPLLAGSLAQLATPGLVVYFKSRKKIVRWAVLLQMLVFLPILIVGLWPLWQVQLFLILAILYGLFQLMAASAWQSWIGDLVPQHRRGRFFAVRSVWVQVMTFVGVTFGGFGLTHSGFTLIFSAAFLSRIVSYHFLGKQEEPPSYAPPEAQFTFWQFVRKMRFNNYGLFVLYSGFFTFSWYIAGPYFSPYVLRTLKFTPLEFMLFQAVTVGAKSIFLPLWGKMSDRYGSRKLLAFSSYLCFLIPLVWLFVDNLEKALWAQVFSGFVWAGIELCSFNFILDCTTPEKRARCASYYQIFVGMGALLGAFVGDFLLRHPFFFAVPYMTTFFVSAIGRLLAPLFFMPRIRELRVVEPISYKDLLLRMLFFIKPGTS